MSIRLKKRHRLRSKDARRLLSPLSEKLGISIPEENVDQARAGDITILLIGGEPAAFIRGDTAFLTLKGILVYEPARRYVTVDMGAVKFVYNGADVMAPGIVEADPSIEPGDMVWVRDQEHHQPLAVGEAVMTGEDMVTERSGKAVLSLHHVGDDLWNLEV